MIILKWPRYFQHVQFLYSCWCSVVVYLYLYWILCNSPKLDLGYAKANQQREFTNCFNKDLPVNKAAGPDDITPRLLKESAKEIAPVLASIFQQSLDEGTLPNDWLVANITPLFKKGNKSVPGNYRPVSLTSISCKLLEHIIHSHVSRHLEHFNILTPKQHGFRKQHSCVSLNWFSLSTTGLWAKDIENNKQIDIAIFDFSKAFDTVPHERLKSKLHHYGIRGRLLHWISTFLCCRKQRVVLNRSHSNWDRVESGVPQAHKAQY